MKAFSALHSQVYVKTILCWLLRSNVQNAREYQGVSYSKKFRVKRGFPNYLEVAISQFRSAKNSYIINIQLFFPNFS